MHRLALLLLAACGCHGMRVDTRGLATVDTPAVRPGGVDWSPLRGRGGDSYEAARVRFMGWGDSGRAQLDLLRTSMARAGLVEEAAAPPPHGTGRRAVETAVLMWTFEPAALPEPTDIPPQRLLNHIPGTPG
jgi:hypothetical protein